MSIPYRTESARIAAGLLSAAALAGAAALHGLWGAGSTWPTGSSDELADLVVGRRPMPGRAACASVAVLLAGAALVTAHATIGTGRSVRRSRTVAAFAATALSRDDTDGLGLGFADWRFNLRGSNTEPLLRLNVEARSSAGQDGAAQVAAQVAMIQGLIGVAPDGGH